MNNKIKVIIGVIVVIVIAILVLVLFNTETENGTMLDFTGEQYNQAEFFAQQYNLKFNIIWENSNKPYGTVLSQSIKKGVVVTDGEEFEIVVSNGQSS